MRTFLKNLLKALLAKVVVLACLFLLIGAAYALYEGAPMSIACAVLVGLALLFGRARGWLGAAGVGRAPGRLARAFAAALLGNLRGMAWVAAGATFVVAAFQVLIHGVAQPKGWRLRLSSVDTALLQLREGLEVLSSSPVFWGISVAALVAVVLRPERWISGAILWAGRWDGRLTLALTAISVLVYGGQQSLTGWTRALVAKTDADVRVVMRSLDRQAQRTAGLILFHEKLTSMSDEEAALVESLLSGATEYARTAPLRGMLGRGAMMGGPVIDMPATADAIAAGPDIGPDASAGAIAGRLAKKRALSAQAAHLRAANEAYQEVVTRALGLAFPDISARELALFVNAVESAAAQLTVEAIPIPENTTVPQMRARMLGWLEETTPTWRAGWDWDAAGLTGVAEANGLGAAAALAAMNKTAEAERAARQARQRARPWWKRMRIRIRL